MNRTDVRSAILAGAALILLGPADLHAGIKTFTYTCTGGAIRTCASAEVETFWNGTNTFVTIRIRNLQGTGLADNTMGSLISGVGLYGATIQGASGLTVGTAGTATNVNDAGSLWSILPSPGTGNIAGPVNFSAGTGRPRGGILGCDPAEATPTRYFQTCGTGGWVVLSFTTTNQIDASQLELAWKTVAVANPASGGGSDLNSIECRTGDPGSCAVVPEPLTMVLLGTGLAGIGGAGLLRRRRRGPETLDG